MNICGSLETYSRKNQKRLFYVGNCKILAEKLRNKIETRCPKSCLHDLTLRRNKVSNSDCKSFSRKYKTESYDTHDINKNQKYRMKCHILVGRRNFTSNYKWDVIEIFYVLIKTFDISCISFTIVSRNFFRYI